MTSPRSTGKGKKFKVDSTPSVPKLAVFHPTYVSFSELPHLERLKVIMKVLRTGEDRYSSEVKELPLQGTNVYLHTIQQPLSESMNKPQSSFSTLNEHVLRASLKTWFYPNEKSRWLKQSKTSKRGSPRIKVRKWELISRVTSIILLASVFLIPQRLGLLYLLAVVVVITGLQMMKDRFGKS